MVWRGAERKSETHAYVSRPSQDSASRSEFCFSFSVNTRSSARSSNWESAFSLDQSIPHGWRLPIYGAGSEGFSSPFAKPIAFLVAYGELAIGLGLVLGILVRPASTCGLAYMLTLLFSSNHPGPHVSFWQYFGAVPDHLVLALCFAAFAVGNPTDLSVRSYLRTAGRVKTGDSQRAHE